jgi:hypothetical protein
MSSRFRGHRLIPACLNHTEFCLDVASKVHLKNRIVAICANGPRQNDKLRPIVEARGGIWEELPSDTFISTSTSVRTVLPMLDA